MMEYILDRTHYEASMVNRFTQKTQVSGELQNLLSDLLENPEAYDSALFQSFSLQEIFNYLQASHVYYIEYWLSKINQSVQLIRHQNEQNSGIVKILSYFVEKYQAELEEHIALEEKVLFSFVSDLLKGTYSSAQKDFVINHFLFTHNDNIIVNLRELKTDLMKADPSLQREMSFQVLFTQLDFFQNDLLLHGLIEDEVFIPKMLNYIHDHFEPLQRI